VEEHEQEDRGDDDPSGPGSFGGRTSREKQVKRLQRQAKRIKKWLEENEAKIGRKGKEITSNITDNESAKMITSHGYIQGYNGQALVDDKHQVVVHALHGFRSWACRADYGWGQRKHAGHWAR
jgi:hypothetical protein